MKHNRHTMLKIEQTLCFQNCSCYLQRCFCHSFATVRATNSNIRMPHFKTVNIKTSLILSNQPWAHHIPCRRRNWLSGSENYFQRNCRLLKFYPWKFTWVEFQICCSQSPAARRLAVADRPPSSGFGLKAKLSLTQTPQVQALVLEKTRRLELPSRSLFSLHFNPHRLTQLGEHVAGLSPSLAETETYFCSNDFLWLWIVCSLWQCSKEHFWGWV